MDNISKDGRYIEEINLWIDEEKFQKLLGYSTKNGDVIISRAGTVGKMCVLNTSFKKSIISTNLIRVRFGKDLLPLYFVSLMTYCKGRMGRLQTGADGTFTHMNTGILDNLKFPYPPIELQIQFSKIVERVRTLEGVYMQSLLELQNLYGTLTQMAFKGKLDLRRLQVEHIIPYKDGGKTTSENLIVISEKENRPKKTKIGKVTLENFYEDEVASLIRKHFENFDFRFADIVKMLQDEEGIAPTYYTTEEIKKHRNINATDIQIFIFSCVEGRNKYLKLSQFFYNSFDDFELKKITIKENKDELLKKLIGSPPAMDREDLNGIYFRIIQ